MDKLNVTGGERPRDIAMRVAPRRGKDKGMEESEGRGAQETLQIHDIYRGRNEYELEFNLPLAIDAITKSINEKYTCYPSIRRISWGGWRGCLSSYIRTTWIEVHMHRINRIIDCP